MSDPAETTTATPTEPPRAIADATETRSCANCGAPLHGRFCAQCGQEDKPLDPPVRHFATAFAQELLDVDGRVPRSFRRLFFSPGFLTREYLAGRRVPWLTPLRLYLIASVAMFGVLAAAGDPGGVQLTFTGDSAEVAERLRSMGFASEAELRAAITAARYTWMPRVMFLLVPLFAWLVALVRRGSGRRFPAHFVFALEIHAAGFGVMAITKGIAALAGPAFARGLEILTELYLLAYIFLALRAVYGGTRLRAARDTAIVAIVYGVALILATGVVVGFAMFGRRWLPFGG